MAVFCSKSESETEAIGAAFARDLPGGTVVASPAPRHPRHGGLTAPGPASSRAGRSGVNDKVSSRAGRPWQADPVSS
jgi:hypothetical protein